MFLQEMPEQTQEIVCTLLSEITLTLLTLYRACPEAEKAVLRKSDCRIKDGTQFSVDDMLNYFKEMTSILSNICVQVKAAQEIPNQFPDLYPRPRFDDETLSEQDNEMY